MHRPWLSQYPEGVPHDLPEIAYTSLVELFDEAFRLHGPKPAFRFMGAVLTFAALDEASRRFASALQASGLKPGDRVALMMPNVFQYPVAVAGVLRAGMVVVNTNPLYTPRELQHQLKDSGAAAIVILENMAATLAECRAQVPELRHVVVTSLAEMLPFPKRLVVDFVVRRVKKMVPPYDLPGAVGWKAFMARGGTAPRPAGTALDDVAVLQYTGGTTGVAKGAMLTHRNLVANVLQSQAWYEPALAKVPASEQVNTVCALPLYHIFGFTVNMLLSMRLGGCNILIPNPRDIPALLKELKRQRFHSFPAVNTLFAAIARHPEAKSVDWSGLILSVGGGMAVQAAVAERWRALTGCSICEGYGLSETSPSASCNSVLSPDYTGTIGVPIPSTIFRILGEDGADVPLGEPGEIAISGPQVMAGYWNRPRETREALTPDGYLLTGDIGIMDERGSVRIVDRKKDMINVSGFNVYPNEVEDVVTRMPGVAEAAAIGVADENSGEAVKLFVVRSDAGLTAEGVKAYCRENLTGYKRPREIEFRDELPKTGVGKILRRALRD
ncbi:AMP-binding protein [Aurantimonas sp. Leaf443]|uniref:AMP-binding protein n=1 Tax=Aurantimonas sp. Leaf443 TaxID=1736378 RepID=UPI0006FE91B8|nr:AMP-binding protein [Aurantimonas sp. Leaf443]KQT82161.1 long-chain fatty acid--CoA ligase [Aurantimonas sp. Leaf443]